MGVGASPEEPRSQCGMTSTSSAFTYDELDAILRGPGGHDGPIGISAIDGLIAALVAAPTFVHPDEWVPLIFGGHKPRMDAGSAEERAVRTIFNRYNEVSTTLSERPHTYIEIPQAVAAIRAICNPYRAAEARAEPKTRRSSRRTRR
jgi:Uncharacterised protein family (UPF0149)